MLNLECAYRLKEDIGFIMEAEAINSLELSKRTGVSRTTLDTILSRGTARIDVYEKIYAYIYESRYRINSVKEELIREKYQQVLFHGSKSGLSLIKADGSRESCDFGPGFYLGETFRQALSFVCEKEKSSVYAFRYTLDNLKVKTFECDLEWMLAICYYRKTMKEYASNERVQSIVRQIEESDVIIAPIADNRMFYIMAQFAEGEINAEVALHSLSASRLGLQYIFRTDKALDNLIPIEKYYICRPECEDCKEYLIARSYETDTKLKFAKREFRTGPYIEELLDERV